MSAGAVLAIDGIISFFVDNQLGMITRNLPPLNYICQELDKLPVSSKCGWGAGLMYFGEKAYSARNEL